MSQQVIYQFIFSDQARNELYKLDPAKQIEIMGEITQLKPKDLIKRNSDVGHVDRDGVTYYRHRISDFRVYLEVKEEIVYCQYILAQHSLSDFIFRFKLPVSDEQLIEQHQSFWKYLDSLK